MSKNNVIRTVSTIETERVNSLEISLFNFEKFTEILLNILSIFPYVSDNN